VEAIISICRTDKNSIYWNGRWNKLCEKDIY
jgi:hypothetical protein